VADKPFWWHFLTKPREAAPVVRQLVTSKFCPLSSHDHHFIIIIIGVHHDDHDPLLCSTRLCSGPPVRVGCVLSLRLLRLIVVCSVISRRQSSLFELLMFVRSTYNFFISLSAAAVKAHCEGRRLLRTARACHGRVYCPKATSLGPYPSNSSL